MNLLSSLLLTLVALNGIASGTQISEQQLYQECNNFDCSQKPCKCYGKRLGDLNLRRMFIVMRNDTQNFEDYDVESRDADARKLQLANSCTRLVKLTPGIAYAYYDCSVQPYTRDIPEDFGLGKYIRYMPGYFVSGSQEVDCSELFDRLECEYVKWLPHPGDGVNCILRDCLLDKITAQDREELDRSSILRIDPHLFTRLVAHFSCAGVGCHSEGEPKYAVQGIDIFEKGCECYNRFEQRDGFNIVVTVNNSKYERDMIRVAERARISFIGGPMDCSGGLHCLSRGRNVIQTGILDLLLNIDFPESVTVDLQSDLYLKMEDVNHECPEDMTCINVKRFTCRTLARKNRCFYYVLGQDVCKLETCRFLVLEKKGNKFFVNDEEYTEERRNEDKIILKK